MKPTIRLKRIYDDAESDDGRRVLVDRLWPRGIKKADAQLDEWCKAVAPSDELRQWFHEDRDERWSEFRERYSAELDEAGDELDRLAEAARTEGLTLLTAAKNRERNHTMVLKEILAERD